MSEENDHKNMTSSPENNIFRPDNEVDLYREIVRLLPDEGFRNQIEFLIRQTGAPFSRAFELTESYWEKITQGHIRYKSFDSYRVMYNRKLSKKAKNGKSS